MVEVKYIRTSEADPAVPLPSHATEGAAGADLRANLPAGARSSGITLAPGERALVPTGLILEIPAGFEVQIRPRSGLALKHGVTLLNAPGTIDSDYRGEIGVILANLGGGAFRVTHGMRIAQMVLVPVERMELVEAESLAESARGAGGFGSTGTG